MRIADLAAGVILGNRYRLKDILGRGGFGDVWRVENLYDEAKPPELALKIYHEQERGNRILFQEARQAMAFVHPRLVRVFDADRVDGIFCMEMEFVPGSTLAQRIGDLDRPKYVSLDEAYRWMLEAAEGLAYLHSLAPPMCHGDIKPDNIIIAPNGVRLMDFGRSRTIEERFVLTNGIGPWFYSAPEVLGQMFDEPGKRYIASDIYAFGVVFYRVLTGRFPRNSLGEIVSLVPFPKPRELNSTIPPELDEIIVKCLEKLPEDRFESAGELVSALRNASITQSKFMPDVQPDISQTESEVDTAYSLIDHAQELAVHKDYEGAIIALDKAMSRMSSNVPVMYIYAHVAKQAGRFEIARKVYKKLIHWMDEEKVPLQKRLEAYEGLGDVAIKLKNYEEAVDCFAHLHEHGADPWYTYRYGVALGLAARYKESIEILKMVYKTNSGNASVCAKIGFAYLQHNNRRLAVQYFNEALMFDAYESTALYYMALIRYLDGRHDKAMQYFTRLRDSDVDRRKIKQLEEQLGISS